MADTPSDTPADDEPSAAQPDAPPETTATAETTTAETTTAETTTTAEPAETAATDDRDDSAGESRDIAGWKLAALAAAVVVLVAGGLLAYHYRGKIFKTAATTTTLSGPIPRIADTFARSDSDTLGKTTSGQQWNQVVGKWGVSNQQAYVAETNPKGPRNFVVVNTGSGDGSVSAKAAHLADGWSLLFRYKAPTGYWRLYWNVQFKAFHLVKFENDKETDAIPGGFLAVNAHEGMDVRVEYLGPSITVFVDNVPIRTVSDAYLTDQTQVGMYVEKDGAADARWTDFVATSGAPATVRTAAPPKGSGGSTDTTKASTGSSAPAG